MVLLCSFVYWGTIFFVYCRNIFFVSASWIWCSNLKNNTHKWGKIHKGKQRKHVYKDDIDPMKVLTEAFSMSTMFLGSNWKNFSDIIEQLQSLHQTKCAPNTKPSYHCPSNVNQSSNFLHPWEILFSRSKNWNWLRSTMTTKRFNNLYILLIHKELTGSINLVDMATNLLRNMMGVEWTWVNLSPVICYDFFKYWLSICILQKWTSDVLSRLLLLIWVDK